MLAEVNASNQIDREYTMNIYKWVLSELEIYQQLKNVFFEDFKNKQYTKKELKDRIVLFNLAKKDIEKQLLQTGDEDFIRKLKGGQLNG